MDKVIDITKIVEKTKVEEKKQGADAQNSHRTQKATNPIFKKLARFTNEKLSKKFDINDLLK